MATKKIDGDLDITGEYKKNGSTLASGTKLYRHEITTNNHPIRVTSNLSSEITTLRQLIENLIAGYSRYLPSINSSILNAYYYGGDSTYHIIVISTASAISDIDITNWTISSDTVTEL